MSRATRGNRGRMASAASRMPGRNIHWDLEAELNQLQEQEQDGLQQDQEEGERQQIEPSPWEATPMEWRPQAEPVRRRPSQARAQQPRPEPPVTQPARGIAQSNQVLRGATGPDFKDAEVRAAVGMAGILRFQCWTRTPLTFGWRTSVTLWMHRGWVQFSSLRIAEQKLTN